MTHTGYRLAPVTWHDPVEHARLIAETANSLRDGKVNSIESFTLTASVASSTLTDARIGPDSFIGFMPRTANAAAEIGNGTMFVSARGQGTATITHANNAQTDRTFTYVVLG